jgi:hypothetical protein
MLVKPPPRLLGECRVAWRDCRRPYICHTQWHLAAILSYFAQFIIAATCLVMQFEFLIMVCDRDNEMAK